jgi:hypothetical protein
MSGEPYLILPPRTAYAISNQRVRVQAYARKPAANAANGFSMRFTADGVSSPWQDFATTLTYAPYSFLYDVPAIVDPSTMKLEIRGNKDSAVGGTGLGTLVDSVAIFPLLEQINSANTATHLGNSAVVTNSVALNAITLPNASYTDSAITGIIAETTIQTVIYTSSGTTTHVQAAFLYIGNNAAAVINVRIKRNGTTILTVPNQFSGIGASPQRLFMFQIWDVPPAGSVTYTVTIQDSGAGYTHQASNRSLSALELKR